MSIEEKVKSTPMDQRPLIDHNGVVSHMNDDQYAEYLRMQEEMANMPPPAPSLEDEVEKQAQEIADLKAALNALLERRVV